MKNLPMPLTRGKKIDLAHGLLEDSWFKAHYEVIPGGAAFHDREDVMLFRKRT